MLYGRGQQVDDADERVIGSHWYYDLAELRRDYGEWITGYTDPRLSHGLTSTRFI